MGNVVRPPWGGAVQSQKKPDPCNLHKPARPAAGPSPTAVPGPRRVSTKILTSAGEIMAFMKISEQLFRLFLRLKMPAVQINRRYFADTDNLEDWFRRLTMTQRTIDDPESPEKGE